MNDDQKLRVSKGMLLQLRRCLVPMDEALFLVEQILYENHCLTNRHDRRRDILDELPP